MIKMFSTQYLANNPDDVNDVFVVSVKDTFFLGLKIKHEESVTYDLSVIDRFTIKEQPKINKIGFKTNTKKRKKNENKSKVSQS